MKQLANGVLFAIILLSSNVAHADPLHIVCAECRSSAFNRDYGNFAFNQVFGENSWVPPEHAGELVIVNPQNDRVFVNLDFVLSNFTSLNLIDLFELEFGWPTGLINIFTQTIYADTANYEVDLEGALIMGGLGVGADADPNSGSGGSSGSGWGSGSGSGMQACTSAGDGVWVCVEVSDN